MKYRKFLILLMASFMAVLLSGCLFKSAEELYAPPKQSAEYYALQRCLDEVLASGAQYCAPVSGDHRQAVQLADLNGDGEDEVLVFLQKNGDQPLKLHIFSRSGDGYEQMAEIAGAGSAFDCVEYRAVDDKPGMEILLGRQVSSQVPQILSVYALREDRVDELLSVNYTEFSVADLNSDTQQEILVFRADAQQTNGIADLYCWEDGVLECSGTASLSMPLTADSIRRIVCGNMQKQIPAVFVASNYEENMILTDVFTVVGGKFCNVSQIGQQENGAQTVRFRSLDAVDIDEDGLIELPSTLRLQKVQENDPAEYYMINWYNLTADGQKLFKLATYHNYTDGWYLVLPEQWSITLMVDYKTDESGYGGYHFYRFDPKKGTPSLLFTIYAFSGGNAKDLAQADDRFLLQQKGDIVYAACFGDDPLSQTLQPEELQKRFHFIYTDWNTGER